MKDMRIVRLSDGKYKVQFKGFFWPLWWSNFTELECSWGDCYTETIIHKSKDAAIKWIIKYEQKQADIKDKKDSAGVVMEISSAEIKEKFAEHFI